MKRALKSSGANVTDQHILDVSMCALFLLQAAKKCDTVFKVFKKPTAHTVRDAAKDISKLLKMLLDKKITTENSGRKEPRFIDPTVSGVSTLTKGEWLEKQLTSKVEDNLQSEQQFRGELDDFDA